MSLLDADANAPIALYMTDAMISKAAVVELVATRVSINRHGLPEGYYRPDMLPNSITDLQSHAMLSGDGAIEIITPDTVSTQPDMIDEDKIRAAYVRLNYDEGFPATPTGEPYWDQLDFEPEKAFELFREYVESGAAEIRVLNSLGSAYNLEDLRIYYKLYYWNTRARAYDLFKAAAGRKKRALDILRMQSDHLKQANQLSDICMTYIESDDFIELLTPKTAVDALKLSKQMERLAHDLPASTPGLIQESPHKPVETILNELTQGDSTYIREGVTAQGERAALLRRRLLDDPDLAKIAQDMILRLNAPENMGNLDED